MAKETDSNKKLPKSPTMDTGNKPISRMEITQRPDGQGSIVYSPFQKDEIEQYSFEEIWSPMGSFRTRASHDKTELTTSFNYETRDYNKGGHSSTHETHVETYVKDTRKVTVEGDNSKEIGRNNYEVTAGQKIASALEGTIENSAAGASEAPTYRLSEGDLIQEHSGNYHQSFGKDKVQNITGNKITMIKEGDYACHVQSGNWDTQVSSEGRLYTSKDLLIESETKITLKVGSSTIVITPSNITLVSARIDLNP